MHLAMNDGVSTRNYHPSHPHYEPPHHETHSTQHVESHRDPGPAHVHMAVAKPASHVDEVHISQAARRLAEAAPKPAAPAPKHEETHKSGGFLSSLWSDVSKVAKNVAHAVEHDVSQAVQEAKAHPHHEASPPPKPAEPKHSSGGFWSSLTQSVGNAVHSVEHVAHEAAHDVGQAAHAVAHTVEHAAKDVERGAQHLEHAIQHAAERVVHNVEDNARRVEHAVTEGVHAVRKEAIHAYQKAKQAVQHDAAAVEHGVAAVGHAVAHAAQTAEHKAEQVGHAVAEGAKNIANHPGAAGLAALEVVGGVTETVAGAALGLVTSETVVGAVVGAAAAVDGASRTGAGLADLASIFNGKMNEVGTHNVLQNAAQHYGGNTGLAIYNTTSFGLSFVGGGIGDAAKVAEEIGRQGKAVVNAVKDGAQVIKDVRIFGRQPGLAVAGGGRLSGVASGSQQAERDGQVMFAAGERGAGRAGDAAGRGESGTGKTQVESSSPYGHIADRPTVGAGKKFTKAQKEKIIQENMKANNGIVKSDKSGTELVKPQKSTKGVTPNSNEWQIDHIDPKSKGGSNSYGNAQVLSRTENREKSNK